MRILLAEDERALGDWLSRALMQSGHSVVWLDDGRLVQGELLDGNFDALVLDLGLPGRDGAQVLRWLRERDSRLPVLVLTARDTLAQRVTSLREGADDFLAKPFELAELEARLLALQRRARGGSHVQLSLGPLVLDVTTRLFTLDQMPLSLSPREHALLTALLQRNGEPVSRRHLIERVFADEDDVQPSVIDVLMHRLRKRLERSNIRIQTYRGLGYALESLASGQS